MSDIPKLFTALAEWSACLVFVLNLRKRFSPVVTAAVMAALLVILCVLQAAIGLASGPLWVVGMIAAMALIYMGILLCCRVRPTDAGLFWAAAFLWAEFTAALEWQISASISGGLADPGVQATAAGLIGSTVFSNLFMLAFYLAAFWVCWLAEHKLMGGTFIII